MRNKNCHTFEVILLILIIAVVALALFPIEQERYSPYKNTGGCSKLNWVYTNQYDDQNRPQYHPYIYPTSKILNRDSTFVEREKARLLETKIMEEMGIINR